jgi:hypothetical protein
MSVDVHGQMPTGSSAQFQLDYDKYLVTKDAFARAVELGRCFGVANQVGITSQAGLSATTPALTLYNPAGSGVTGRLWMASAQFEVAFTAAASVWLCAGTNVVAAATTGTLTTAHRNLKLGGVQQGNRIVAFLAATLPAAPVAIDLLGVGLTGAITTATALSPMTKWYNGAILIQPGTNISIQTSTASGTVSTLLAYFWEECNLIS